MCVQKYVKWNNYHKSNMYPDAFRTISITTKCRAYSAVRDDPSAVPIGVIGNSTQIASTHDAQVALHHGRYGFEALIASLAKDGSKSRVVINRSADQQSMYPEAGELWERKVQTQAIGSDHGTGHSTVQNFIGKKR